VLVDSVFESNRVGRGILAFHSAFLHFIARPPNVTIDQVGPPCRQPRQQSTSLDNPIPVPRPGYQERLPAFNYECSDNQIAN
jgi:hypothetical protein